MRYFGVLGLALVIGLLGVTVHASPAPAAEALSADTPLTTAGGATFTAPMGWSVTSDANRRVLDPPEADSHLVLLDLQATDADAAVAAGWASYRPDGAARSPRAGMTTGPYLSSRSIRRSTVSISSSGSGTARGR
jgi:hypothetical protein